MQLIMVEEKARATQKLRSAMSQESLNAVAVCHINQLTLDNLNLRQLAHEFAQSAIRKSIFGMAPF